MRTILAGMFVFVCLLAGIALLGWLSPDPPVWLAALFMVAVLFGSIIFASFAFNRRTLGRLNVEGQARRIAEYEEKGWLVEHEFFAKRAFQVEEFEDEGSHYFLELNDATVLFMTGQYLYDYEVTPRRFPCRHFLVSRYRYDDSVVRLKCSAEPLELDGVAPHFVGENYEKEVPADGEIIGDMTYDELFAKWMRKRTT